MSKGYGKQACRFAGEAGIFLCLPWVIWWGHPEPEALAWFGLVMGVIAALTSILAGVLWLAHQDAQ